MKRMMLVGVAAGLSCLTLSLKAQESKSDEKSPTKVLAASEGTWDAEITTTVPGPDGKIETQTSKGVETNRLLAGKWLLSDFKGDFFGMAFEGHGQTGYDAKKGSMSARGWTRCLNRLTPWMELTTRRPRHSL